MQKPFPACALMTKCRIASTHYTVLCRSIFDAVRDLLHDEAFEEHEKVMAKYLKPDLLILDDMGMKQLPADLRQATLTLNKLPRPFPPTD